MGIMDQTAEKTLEAQLEELLSEDVDSARQRAETAFDREVAPFGDSIVLFGAGNIGRRILARLREDGIEPLAFSDNNASSWGKTIDGLPVLKPAEAAERFGREAAFMVTIYNPWHNFVDTRKQLQELGCEKMLSVITYRWKHHTMFLPHFRDDLPYKVLPHAAEIRRAFRLWADEASRREFVAQVKWRLTGDYDDMAPLSGRDSYFGEDFFPMRPDEVVVDCGAFDGDTLKTLIRQRGASFARYVALEPDPESFEKLNRLVNSLPDECRSKMTVHPYAVGASRRRVKFSAQGSLCSSISETGTVEVECVVLDGLLSQPTPTLVKMDIEGAEPDALQGAGSLIEGGKTAFCACVYHEQNHLWSIPLQLHLRNPDLRYYLRAYQMEGWDLICYAIPEDRVG
jgi:FkbM family methyltransferase